MLVIHTYIHTYILYRLSSKRLFKDNLNKYNNKNKMITIQFYFTGNPKTIIDTNIEESIKSFSSLRLLLNLKADTDLRSAE